MLQRIRRSFRRKKASVCINCGHADRQCYHKEYENINILAQAKADHLKWLDLDLEAPPKLNNSRQRPANSHLEQQRPHSAYNDYSNVVFNQDHYGARVRLFVNHGRKIKTFLLRGTSKFPAFLDICTTYI